jgi:transposase
VLVSDKESSCEVCGIDVSKDTLDVDRGKRIIRGGRTVVRQTLDMATLVATKHNPKIKAFYHRLLQAPTPSAYPASGPASPLRCSRRRRAGFRR